MSTKLFLLFACLLSTQHNPTSAATRPTAAKPSILSNSLTSTLQQDFSDITLLRCCRQQKHTLKQRVHINSVEAVEADSNDELLSKTESQGLQLNTAEVSSDWLNDESIDVADVDNIVASINSSPPRARTRDKFLAAVSSFIDPSQSSHADKIDRDTRAIRQWFCEVIRPDAVESDPRLQSYAQARKTLRGDQCEYSVNPLPRVEQIVRMKNKDRIIPVLQSLDLLKDKRALNNREIIIYVVLKVRLRQLQHPHYDAATADAFLPKLIEAFETHKAKQHSKQPGDERSYRDIHWVFDWMDTTVLIYKLDRKEAMDYKSKLQLHTTHTTAQPQRTQRQPQSQSQSHTGSQFTQTQLQTQHQHSQITQTQPSQPSLTQQQKKQQQVQASHVQQPTQSYNQASARSQSPTTTTQTQTHTQQQQHATQSTASSHASNEQTAVTAQRSAQSVADHSLPRRPSSNNHHNRAPSHQPTTSQAAQQEDYYEAYSEYFYNPYVDDWLQNSINYLALNPDDIQSLESAAHSHKSSAVSHQSYRTVQST